MRALAIILVSISILSHPAAAKCSTPQQDCDRHGEAAEALTVAWAQEAPTTRAPQKKPETTVPEIDVTIIEDRLTLRQPFNAAKGKVRNVAFLSPTCPRCLNNISEIYNGYLKNNPEAAIELFFVWVKGLSTDNVEAISEAAQRVPDSRISHYWDEGRVLNNWLLDAIMMDIHMRIYDVFLIYDADAEWGKRLPRPGYWLHQIPGAPGPQWNINLYVRQMDKAVNGEAFDIPY